MLADLHAGNLTGMMGMLAQARPEAMSMPHTPSGWLSFGVCFIAIGLMHVVFPRFMWRIRGNRRGPDVPFPSDAALTRHRWLGAALAAVGVVVTVLTASNTLR
ncbi:hypothetical protein KDL01_11520 [Actinospica durhamensis]|uniref:DUF6199 domain-containing protein n=1 Tax=Actinospica durhamensis TaxID=1508375 RepID=A0A941EK04_9ACTN|nr:hypothetical protein [Actinospica durhamensis]MBR7833900.1 hypothetical protein [Actinospica durhamensis]